MDNFFILMMIIIVIMMVSDQERLKRRAIATKKRKNRGRVMASELLKSYVGKFCHVDSGQFSGTVKGTITAVEDNWIELTNAKEEKTLLNADFLTSIREVMRK